MNWSFDITPQREAENCMNADIRHNCKLNYASFILFIRRFDDFAHKSSAKHFLDGSSRSEIKTIFWACRKRKKKKKEIIMKSNLGKKWRMEKGKKRRLERRSSKKKKRKCFFCITINMKTIFPPIFPIKIIAKFFFVAIDVVVVLAAQYFASLLCCARLGRYGWKWKTIYKYTTNK